MSSIDTPENTYYQPFWHAEVRTANGEVFTIDSSNESMVRDWLWMTILQMTQHGDSSNVGTYITGATIRDRNARR